jgi:hypothetical protein
MVRNTTAATLAAASAFAACGGALAQSCPTTHDPITLNLAAPGSPSAAGSGGVLSIDGPTIATNRKGSSLSGVAFRLVNGAWVEEPLWGIAGNGYGPRSGCVVGDTIYFGYISAWTGGASVGAFTRTVAANGAASWPLAWRIDRQAAVAEHVGSALSVAGDEILLGAENTSARGRVYVYRRSAANAWQLAATLFGSDPAQPDSFGTSIAREGDTMVVGSPGADVSGVANVGAAYVFAKIDGTWTLEARLDGDVAAPSMHFGRAAAMSGGAIAVGAFHDAALSGDTGPLLPPGGYVRVFEKVGGVWTLAGQFGPSQLGTSGYGAAVAMRPGRLFVGAYLADPLGAQDAGEVFSYTKVNGAWAASGQVLSGQSGEWSGFGMAMSDDWVVVGNAFSAKLKVFDQCALPPDPGATPRCVPTVTGLFTYILAWFQQAPYADFDASGTIDTTDLFAYLNAWVAGCP